MAVFLGLFIGIILQLMVLSLAVKFWEFILSRIDPNEETGDFVMGILLFLLIASALLMLAMIYS